MSLSVVKRPEGRVLDSTAVSAAVTSSSGALFTKTSHGLTNGDYIYVSSSVDAYNGFWYVSFVSINTFRIREYETAIDQPYIKDATVSYYKSILTHGWQCVHLPIVYKLKSTIWPTNSDDTARSITSFSNYNGYTYINASGDIKATGVAASLEQVILSGTSVDGVYKIIQWFSDTNFVINLAYSAGNVLSTGSVQYYYYNYCAIVRVFAGIPSGHTWEFKKEYEQVAEIQLIPDQQGVVTVNISDFIKKKIEVIKNNALLYTLPNNIDAWCNFYISYAESYDDSNGYTVETYTSSFISDQSNFEGYAVNAKLPFKSKYSGHLSEYVSGLTSNTRQGWLTVFDSPTLFVGKYFDISYINNSASSGSYIKRQVYVRNVLKEEFIDTQSDGDQGVYRYVIEQSGWSEDRIDITLYNSSNVQLSETLTITVNQDCSQNDFYLVWMNYLGGYDYWNFTAKKEYFTDVLESKTSEQNVYTNWPNSYGEFADSILKQTLRKSKSRITVSSQFLSTEQEDAIKYIVGSPLVQICVSQQDRRTVIVDPSTLRIRKDRDKTRTLTIGVTYTDELPAQQL